MQRQAKFVLEGHRIIADDPLIVKFAFAVLASELLHPDNITRFVDFYGSVYYHPWTDAPIFASPACFAVNVREFVLTPIVDPISVLDL